MRGGKMTNAQEVVNEDTPAHGGYLIGRQVLGTVRIHDVLCAVLDAILSGKDGAFDVRKLAEGIELGFFDVDEFLGNDIIIIIIIWIFRSFHRRRNWNQLKLLLLFSIIFFVLLLIAVAAGVLLVINA